MIVPIVHITLCCTSGVAYIKYTCIYLITLYTLYFCCFLHQHDEEEHGLLEMFSNCEKKTFSHVALSHGCISLNAHRTAAETLKYIVVEFRKMATQ